jgi:hypothetical protein
MDKFFNEVVAAWIVAIALVGAMAAHTLLPKTPPHFAGVVSANTPRPAANLPNPGVKGDSDLPLVEFGFQGAFDELDREPPPVARPTGRGSDISSETRLGRIRG